MQIVGEAAALGPRGTDQGAQFLELRLAPGARAEGDDERDSTFWRAGPSGSSARRREFTNPRFSGFAHGGEILSQSELRGSGMRARDGT